MTTKTVTETSDTIPAEVRDAVGTLIMYAVNTLFDRLEKR